MWEFCKGSWEACQQSFAFLIITATWHIYLVGMFVDALISL